MGAATAPAASWHTPRPGGGGAPALADFLGAHRGETAWLFGKGPSFERFTHESAGALRVCLNETCYAVPAATYLVALDPLNPYAARIPRTLRCVFQPRRTLQDRFLAAVPPPGGVPLCAFDDSHSTRPLDETPAAACHLLHAGEGSALAAIQILRIMGVTTVVFVGLDGGGGYGRQWAYRHRPEFDHAYADIRRHVDRLCRQWAIAADWSHCNPLPAG